MHLIRPITVFSGLALLQFVVCAPAAWCAEERIISIPSASMGKNYKATMILPASYASSDNYYSVVYLLHGFGGDHTTWLRIAPLKRFADSLQILLLCPDGDDSWYIDSPFRKNSLFETFLIREVIPFIDSGYRVFSHADGRALMGISMGGHGAMALLAKHPDIFMGACSIAGIMDLTEFPLEWNLSNIFGPFTENARFWKDQSCVSLAGKLSKRSKLIVLDCGSEDFALRGNRHMASLLRKAGVRHCFFSRHGLHEWRYAGEAAARHLSFFGERLRAAQ